MFIKIFLAIISTLSLSYGVDEFSSERLLGIEVGYSTISSSNEIGINQKSRDVEVGFRIGAQNEEWRTTIRASFMETQGRDYQKVMIDFDRFVWASLYKTDSILFKPYLGAHLGWLRYSDDISLSDNGLAYGGQMGLALNVLNQVDFDLGYRYSIVDTQKVSDIGSFVFSVNYLY